MGVFFFATLFIFPIFADNITTSPADCNNTVLSTADGPATLTAQYRPNTIDIAWYSDNVKITGDATAATTCTYNGTFTLPTPPTKLGYVFDGWKAVPDVPNGYTKLEYIQSSGTSQYINTGRHFFANHLYEFSYKAAITTNVAIAGTSNGSSASNGASWDFIINNAGMYYWNGQANSSTRLTLSNVDINSWHTYRFKGTEQILFFDEVSRWLSSYTNAQWESNNNIFLFKSNRGGTPSSGAAGVQFSYYKEYDENGVLLMNLIPAKNSSNVVGMYDTVTGQFFTNEGTGTFTAGPNAHQ